MGVKAGYKRTEVGVIPEEWEVKRLAEISPRQSVGVVIEPSKYFDERGSVPFLVGSNVTENSIVWWDAKRISDQSNQLLSTSKLATGDLVTVRVGAPGVTAVIPPDLDGCNCASMMIIRKSLSFDSDWLSYLLNSPIGREQVEHVQYGTAQKQFNISDAVSFVFPVPSLLEQRAIATALSDVDALLTQLDRLIAKKRDIKQAAMQQLLTGKTRLPGFGGEWRSGTVGDVVEALEAGVSVNSLDDPPTPGAPSVLKTSAVSAGKFLPEECKRITAADIPRARINPLANTILISRMNTPDLVGEVAYVPVNHRWLFLPDRLWMTRFKPGARVDARWLAYLLSSRAYQQQIKAAATGTSGSMKNISKDSLLSIPVPFPEHEEQTAIATLLSDLDAELAALETRRDKTRTLKQGMMQELLTGRTRLI